MQASAFDAAPSVLVCSARSNCGKDKPNAPRLPTRSNSRREKLPLRVAGKILATCFLNYGKNSSLREYSDWRKLTKETSVAISLGEASCYSLGYLVTTTVE